MFRYLLTAAILTPLAFSQTFPAFQWATQVDTSVSDSLAGVGVDSAGNTYIAGSTYSPNFPVKNGVQPHTASAGLYLITGPGPSPAFTALGISSASFVAIDPRNSSTSGINPQNTVILYAISNGVLLQSMNGGGTFTALSLPSSEVATLAIDPSNGQILYAGTFDQGLFKSTDGGATWSTSNGSLQALQPGQFEFQSIWIDPDNPSVLLAYAIGNFYRSGDAGNTWKMILSDTFVLTLNFDTAVPGLIYITDNQGDAWASTDDGQTFSSLKVPAGFGAILPDPTQSGHLVALSLSGLYVSTNSGSSWAQAGTFPSTPNLALSAADWAHGFLYFASSSQVIRVTTDLHTMTPVGPPATGFIASIAAANGVAYVANGGSPDVYVTKLDASGNLVYSTYFGGSNDDVALAMTVDQSGNVYVTGTTSSLDFPVTKGAYATTGTTFLFKLNPDGSVGYSTYGPAGAAPASIAVDASGAAYIAGTSNGGLTTTAGAYEPTCSACGIASNGFFGVLTFSGFASKLDSTGSTLVYSTYVGPPIQLTGNLLTAIAIASDGSAYLGGGDGILHLNPAGSALLGSVFVPGSVSPSPTFTAQSLGVAADGTVYAAGAANTFPVTTGAFQSSYAVLPSLADQNSNLPAAVIVHYDAQLANVLNATFFGPGKSANAMAFDSNGNLYIGGGTAQSGLPTRTPFQLGFANQTGFVSELSSDLSTLLFSSYFGDTQSFAVAGLGVRKDGSVVLGGGSVTPNNPLLNPFTTNPETIWVNSLTLAPPPALRVDSVINAASQLDGPISAGETVVVQGAGFGSDAELTIGGIAVQPISMTSTSITATVAQTVPAGAAEFQVTSGGSSSNQVLVEVNATAPGIFSQNGSGFGQGYILNKNGTPNTPSNPAAPGDPIAIFATGVGPVSLDQGYAQTQYPVNLYIDGIFCDGIEAFLGPVQGLPGNVFEIQVFVPNPANLVSANPNLQGFVFPPVAPLIMNVDDAVSQNGLTISIAQP